MVIVFLVLLLVTKFLSLDPLFSVHFISIENGKMNTNVGKEETFLIFQMRFLLDRVAFWCYHKNANEFLSCFFLSLLSLKIKFVKLILMPSMRSGPVKEKFNNCYFLFSLIVNMFVTSHLGIFFFLLSKLQNKGKG